jgi:HIV Tat-specific factor 1
MNAGGAATWRSLDYRSTSTRRDRATARYNGNGRQRECKETLDDTVYATGLPLDAEVYELVERFLECDVVEDDEPKVKMYAKDDGSFLRNGDTDAP